MPLCGRLDIHLSEDSKRKFWVSKRKCVAQREEGKEGGREGGREEKIEQWNN